MGYSGSQNEIIKQHNLPWLLILVFALAAIVAISFGKALLTQKSTPEPSWAPSGCHVTYSEISGKRVLINIQDTENFDTEAEVAYAILAALEGEAEFFSGPGHGQISRGVEIAFPRQAGGYIPIVQYHELAGQGEIYNTLVMRHSTRMVREIRGMTIRTLMEIASGDKELGFLILE